MTDPTYEARVSDSKSRIQEISPRDAVAERAERSDVVFLDVREPQEWNLFHIPGATLIPLGALADRVESQIPHDKRVIIYCARGNRSALAADLMQQMGYVDVVSLAEGIRGWAYAGGEIEE
jgi:rhodanese-related sulfurtransferase